MKIGFLAGTLGRGGAERQLIYMLQALSNEGIETRVLCLTKGEAFEKKITDLGVDVDWIGSSRNKFVRLGKIARNIRNRPIDILQSVHFYTNIYAAIAGRTSGVHSIGAIRNDLTSEIAANHIFGKWHLKLPQTLIANSQLALNRAIDKGIHPENIDLVRNVVVAKNVAKTRSTNKSCIRILFAGRLVPQKRPELFIDMASQLRENLADWEMEFVIAGDGPLRFDLERLAQERGFENNALKFLGEVSEMSALYLSSDILVLTSEHEGTPNVVLEAMAYGLPLVATRVGGVPEIVKNNECGILVDAGNLAEMIRAVTKLIVDQNLRLELGRQGQEYVRKNHSIGYLQDRLKGIYSTLLGSSG